MQAERSALKIRKKAYPSVRDVQSQAEISVLKIWNWM